MTERQMRTAILGGIPFVVHMTDGRKFDVPDSSRITLGPTSVIIVDAEGTPFILPLGTIRTVTFGKSGG